jgi:hypothetical protein
VANFCQDYLAAADAYQQTSGDVTDPNFATFLSSLTKAQAEAPAAVKGDVTTMLNEAKKVQAQSSSAQNVQADLTAPSTRVTNWGDSHCPNSAASSGNSDSGSAAAPTTAPAATTPDNSTPSAASSASSPSVAAFCSDAGNIVTELGNLGQSAAENDGTSAAPSNSDWQKADADVHKLDSQSPSVILNHGSSSFTPEYLVSQLANDVDMIVSDGWDHSNEFGGGSGGDDDLAAVQGDSDWCPGGASAVADAQDRGTNGSPSEPLAPATADSGVNGNLNTGSSPTASTSTTQVTDSNGNPIIPLGGN